MGIGNNPFKALQIMAEYQPGSDDTDLITTRFDLHVDSMDVLTNLRFPSVAVTMTNKWTFAITMAYDMSIDASAQVTDATLSYKHSRGGRHVQRSISMSRDGGTKIAIYMQFGCHHEKYMPLSFMPDSMPTTNDSEFRCYVHAAHMIDATSTFELELDIELGIANVLGPEISLAVAMAMVKRLGEHSCLSRLDSDLLRMICKLSCHSQARAVLPFVLTVPTGDVGTAVTGETTEPTIEVAGLSVSGTTVEMQALVGV